MAALVMSLRKWLETSSLKQKYSAVLLAFSLLSTLGLLLMRGVSGTTNDPLQSSPFYFVSAFAKLAVVLLLIVACSVIFRRWFQPYSNGGKSRQMQVIETVRLSPKQALHLVSIGDRRMLIGATDQNISLITPVELNLSPAETDIVKAQAAPDFTSLLQALSFRSPVDATRKG